MASVIKSKAGLEPKTYAELEGLLKAYDRDPKQEQSFTVDYLGRRRFALYVLRGPQVIMCYQGPLAGVLGYLRGVIHGHHNHINL